MLRIRLHLPDPTVATLAADSADSAVKCGCNALLTGADSHHLHTCKKTGFVPMHDKVNATFLSFFRFANLSVLGDGKFRPCGRVAKKKLPDGAIYNLLAEGGPLVIDTTISSPLCATHLNGSASKYCHSVMTKRKDKFKEYLGRFPVPSDFRYQDKAVDDPANPLSMADISDGLGKISFLPLSLDVYGGCAPEVSFVLSILASRLAERFSNSSSSHLYGFFKSTMKKNLSQCIANQLCIAHTRARDWLINNQRYHCESVPSQPATVSTP
jgi:hypothetical protein